MHVIWWGHNVLYFIFIGVYSLSQFFSEDFYGVGWRVLVDVTFWLLTIVVLAAAAVLDTALEWLRLQTKPTIADIFAEIDRGYLPLSSIEAGGGSQPIMTRLKESLGIFSMKAAKRGEASRESERISSYDYSAADVGMAKRADLHRRAGPPAAAGPA